MRRRAGIAAVVLLAGCSTGDGLEPLEARVRTPDQRATLDIDGCGRDDDVIVLGASSASVLVQLLLVLDGDEVVLEASGLTVTLADRGTLGAGDADVIEAEGAAGTITSARVRGDRIDVVADARPISSDSDLSAGEVELAARCTADEELALGPQASSSTRSAVASSTASRAARIRPRHHSISSAARRTRSARTSTSTSTSSISRRIDSSSVTASP